MDLRLGEVSEGQCHIDFQKLRAIRHMVRDGSGCTRCFCRWTCAGGCHVSNAVHGDGSEYAPFCIHTRLITAARLLFKLGESRRVEDLLSDVSGMKRLALNPDDRLTAWRSSDV